MSGRLIGFNLKFHQQWRWCQVWLEANKERETPLQLQLNGQIKYFWHQVKCSDLCNFFYILHMVIVHTWGVFNYSWSCRFFSCLIPLYKNSTTILIKSKNLPWFEFGWCLLQVCLLVPFWTVSNIPAVFIFLSFLHFPLWKSNSVSAVHADLYGIKATTL